MSKFKIIEYNHSVMLHDVAMLMRDSFLDDPMWQFLLDGYKFKSIQQKQVLFEAFILLLSTLSRIVHSPGPLGIYVVQESQTNTIAGISCWFEPGDHLHLYDLFKHGWIFTLPKHLGFKKTVTAIKLLARTDTCRHNFMQPIAKPYLYLNKLAVSPTFQGHGLGRKLVELATHQADLAQLDCFVESSNPRNLSFYNRCGFEVISTIQNNDLNAPSVYCMRRKPKLGIVPHLIPITRQFEKMEKNNEKKQQIMKLKLILCILVPIVVFLFFCI